MKVCFPCLKAAMTVIVVALLLGSCKCPQSSVTNTIDSNTTEKSDTTYHDIDLNLAADSSDAIEFNVLTFCDSVYKGLIQFPYALFSYDTATVKIDTAVFAYPIKQRRNLKTALTVDSDGKGKITCNEDALKIKVKDQATIINERDTKIKELEKIVTERRGYRFYQSGFFIAIGLLLFVLYFLIKRK